MRKASRLLQITKFAFFTLIILIQPMIARAQNHISTFEQVNQFFVDDPSRTLEDLLPKLDPKIRSNYSLAYASNSEVGSSLLKPRVILSSPDAKFILAYAGDPDAKGGQQLEMIRVNPDTHQPEFKVVDFANKQAVVDHHPAACAACHAEGLGTKNLRHIWETYPDWPGFYGTAHNNDNFGRPGDGTSSLPHFEYEEKNFKQFLATEAKGERFKHLIGLGSQDLSKLAEYNSSFTDRIGRVNGMRFMQRVAESPNFAKNVNRIEGYLHGVPNYRENLKFQPDEKKVRAAIEKYYDEKAKRVTKLVQKFGTDADKALIESALFQTTEKNHYAVSKKIALAAFDLKMGSAENTAWFVDYVQKNLGISANDISTTRFAGQFAMATGEDGNYAGTGVKTQIGGAYDDFFKSKSILKKPTVIDGEHQMFKKTLAKATSAHALTDMLDVDQHFIETTHPDRVKYFKTEIRKNAASLIDLAESKGDIEAYAALKAGNTDFKKSMNQIAETLPEWKVHPQSFEELEAQIKSGYFQLADSELKRELILARAKEILDKGQVTPETWKRFIKSGALGKSQLAELKDAGRELHLDLPGLEPQKSPWWTCFGSTLERLIPIR